MRNFIIFTSLKILLGDQMKENEMVCVCSIYERKEVPAKYLWENLKERETLEDAGIDGRIMLKWLGQEDV